jgi:hypothetical protein
LSHEGKGGWLAGFLYLRAWGRRSFFVYIFCGLRGLEGPFLRLEN